MSQMFLDAMSGFTAGAQDAGATIQQAQLRQVDAAWKNRELANKEELQAEQITSLRQSRDLAAVSSEREGKKLDQDILSSNKNMQLAVANYKLQEKQVLANLETGKITKEAAQLQLDELKNNKDLNAETRALGLETVANKREQLKPLAEQAENKWKKNNPDVPFPPALKTYFASAELTDMLPDSITAARSRASGASTTAGTSTAAGTNDIKLYLGNLESLADIKIKLDAMPESTAKTELQVKYKKAVDELADPKTSVTGGIGIATTTMDKIGAFMLKADAAKAAIEKRKGGGGEAAQTVESPVIEQPVVRDLTQPAPVARPENREIFKMEDVKPAMGGDVNELAKQKIASRVKDSVNRDVIKLMGFQDMPMGASDAQEKIKAQEEVYQEVMQLLPDGVIPTQSEITQLIRQVINTKKGTL